MSTKLRDWPSGPQRARRAACATACVTVLLIAGCTSNPYKYSMTEHRDLGLAAKQLEEHGLAVVTPLTVTGQEEEKQAVAFVFVEVLKHERPRVRLVGLPETLSAINSAGLADQYHRAYLDYRDSGILQREALVRISEVTGARYVAALKLSVFAQSNENRFGVFGFRILDTKRANVRVFLQLWDAASGRIVWEGLQETTSAKESVSESLITFRQALGEAFAALIERFPDQPDSLPSARIGPEASAASVH